MFSFVDSMSLYRDVLEISQLNVAIAVSASEVILRRNMLMANGTMTNTEMTRMVMEKHETFVKSVNAAAGVALGGGSPAGMMRAALVPFGNKTRSNAQRLRR
ncbi:hypothetical protein FDP22_03215 [Paroceanicella profunda]|uniref:Uncharacterized protein n=1 Tax=Paroceanicella profunda TaxID=2579971 RepID=A0A5B8FG83_9RHOB|nr:hypothetical protein [Paroceanicella profunda]QDL90881.1 hypothetical protein FDP22_03215 [Paroceanicella profunda]